MTPEPLYPQLLVVAGFDSAQAVSCGTGVTEYLPWVEISPKSSATNLCLTWSRTLWMSHIPQKGSAPQDPSTFLQQSDDACFVPYVGSSHAPSYPVTYNHAAWCIPKRVNPAILFLDLSQSIIPKIATLHHPQFVYPNSFFRSKHRQQQKLYCIPEVNPWKLLSELQDTPKSTWCIFLALCLCMPSSLPDLFTLSTWNSSWKRASIR